MKEEGIVFSAFLEEGILVKPGVFDPGEAEEYVLPLMLENAERFRDKAVLEIGTGSGPISLYAAKLGASRVVATDIDVVALACARENARRMGVDDVIETRLVTPDDLSAFAVIEPDERFDVIISNPPYSLDLDAEANTPAVDTGDLGLSIIQGLPRHLAPDGVAFLLYNSLFYHYVMVKYAEREGYRVRSHTPSMLTMWEAQALFNAYLDRFLLQEGIDSSGMHFDHRSDRYLYEIRVRSEVEPLFSGNSRRPYPGMIVIERP
jgi:predicted RNA methylase